MPVCGLIFILIYPICKPTYQRFEMHEVLDHQVNLSLLTVLTSQNLYVALGEGGSVQENTNADLSDKTESATSFAFQVSLSCDVRKRVLGGPICNQENQS